MFSQVRVATRLSHLAVSFGKTLASKYFLRMQRPGLPEWWDNEEERGDNMTVDEDLLRHARHFQHVEPLMRHLRLVMEAGAALIEEKDHIVQWGWAQAWNQ